MAETTQLASKQEGPKPQNNNLLSLLPKFQFNFPPFSNSVKKSDVAAAKDGTRVQDDDVGARKPDTVKFREPQPLVPPPLKVECDEAAEKSTDPAVLWQVYALGGFLIIKWVWARWNERRAKKGSSDERGPVAEE